jgi:hypothetical protein
MKCLASLRVIIRNVCGCKQTEQNAVTSFMCECAFWLVLCVHYTRIRMHTERPVHSGLCYVCSPDSCMNVYSKKNALWLLLHAFTRYFPAHRYIKPTLLQHIWVTERHQEASLATCVQLVTVQLYC